MNDKKLYYLQKMGLNPWIQTQPKKMQWKIFFLIDKNERENEAAFLQAVRNAFVALISEISEIDLISCQDDAMLDTTTSYLCFNFSTDFSKSMEKKLSEMNVVFRIIDFPCLSNIAASGQIKKKLWTSFKEQAALLNHA